MAKSRLGPTFRQLTNDRRMMPTFLIVGAMKAGTTFLHRILAQHPEVRDPWRKEMHFFDVNYSRGMGWYRAYFPYREAVHGRACITGDSTPSYMFHPLAPERMAKHLPDAKLIVVLREPASRALSQYQMALWRGMEALSFEEALEREEERTQSELQKILGDSSYPGHDYLRYSYRGRGLYLEQILRLEKHFPKENILVIDSGMLFNKTDCALIEVEKFLGISEWTADRYEPEAAAKTKATPKPETMASLREFYRPHDQALFEHLGWEPRW